MNLLTILESFSALNIVAALIPSVSFLLLLLYYTVFGSKKSPKPKIVTLKEPIKVIGVSTKTSRKTFAEDDRLLWKEYKLTKERGLIKNKKEEHSFIAVRKASPDEDSWEYLIGDIVYDFNEVPVGLKTVEVPPISYAAFHIHVENENSWAPTIMKVEKYIYEKWLPKSKFKLDINSPVREIEYHDKRTPETTRTMIFYVPICRK